MHKTSEEAVISRAVLDEFPISNKKVFGEPSTSSIFRIKYCRGNRGLKGSFSVEDIDLNDLVNKAPRFALTGRLFALKMTSLRTYFTHLRFNIKASQKPNFALETRQTFGTIFSAGNYLEFLFD
jgi:hypothetical protein